MRKLIYSFCLLVFVYSVSVNAELDDKIYINGKIGNAFDKEKIKVIDSHHQMFYLPRSVFPKDFRPKQGEDFSVEISVQQFKEIEIIKKTIPASL